MTWIQTIVNITDSTVNLSLIHQLHLQPSILALCPPQSVKIHPTIIRTVLPSYKTLVIILQLLRRVSHQRNQLSLLWLHLITVVTPHITDTPSINNLRHSCLSNSKDSCLNSKLKDLLLNNPKDSLLSSLKDSCLNNSRGIHLSSSSLVFPCLAWLVIP